MEISNLLLHLEALIFASDKPLVIDEMAELLNGIPHFSDQDISINKIEAALQIIVEKYSADYFAFEVVQSGGGWQFLTRKEYFKTVSRLSGEKYLKKLSSASLETLAIIAYKQPVTKSDIELIRGVNSDYAVQKLLEKDLIVIMGRKEDAPGQPLLYAPSKNFMDYFGINSIADLPKLQEIVPDELVTATNVTDLP